MMAVMNLVRRLSSWEAKATYFISRFGIVVL